MSVEQAVSSLQRTTAKIEGQALLEFALMVPMLFLLIAGMVDFGGFIYAWTTVAHAARSAAQYSVLGGIWLDYGGGAVPTQGQLNANNLTALVSKELAALPRAHTILACQYNNGTLSRTLADSSWVSGGTSSCPPTFTSDTEPVLAGSGQVYSLVMTEVSYSYSPFITSFNFPRLGISLPAIFSNAFAVKRRVVMRAIQ